MSQNFEVFTDTVAYTNTDVSSGTVLLTTSGADRICLLLLHHVGTGGNRRSITGVSSAGLTWAKYTDLSFDSSDTANRKQKSEVWWAYAAAQQSSATVTVTMDGACHDLLLICGSVSGVPAARWANPFDADPSLPDTYSNPSTTFTAHTRTVSTHDANTVMFAFWGACIQNSSNDPGVPTGWTNLSAHVGGGADSSPVKHELMAKVFTVKQTNAVIDFSVGSHTTANDGQIIFAVGGDPIFPTSRAVCAGF